MAADLRGLLRAFHLVDGAAEHVGETARRRSRRRSFRCKPETVNGCCSRR